MISLYINNTPSSSKTINSKANSVNVQLQPPILLDPKKQYQLRVLNANIVYCENNITSANNKFTYTYNGTTYTKTIPVGLYSIDDINNTIARFTTVQNGQQLFAFVANEATATIIVYFATANTFIDCSAANTVMTILGFSSSVIGGFTGTDGWTESTNTAQLNTLTQILVTSNITNGAYVNGQYSNCICGISINTLPFSSILFDPIHPTRNNVYRNRIDNIIITLQNQNGENLDFTSNGTQPPEAWNLTLAIEPIEMASLL